MDPRLQRILLVGLFFVVSLGLVRSFSSQAALQRLRLAKAEKANIGPDELDVTGLKPANATLGVSVPNRILLYATTADAIDCSSVQ